MMGKESFKIDASQSNRNRLSNIGLVHTSDQYDQMNEGETDKIQMMSVTGDGCAFIKGNTYTAFEPAGCAANKFVLRECGEDNKITRTRGELANGTSFTRMWCSHNRSGRLSDVVTRHM
jgi:hypothetical protein